MGWNDLVYVIDLLREAGVTHVDMCGEPLRHPLAADYLKYVIARDMSVTLLLADGVVTDGGIIRTTGALLADADPCRLDVVVKLPAPEAVLDAFAPFASLAIDGPADCDGYKAVAAAVIGHGLRRRVRVTMGRDTAAMRARADALMAALPLLEAAGIVVSLDCGAPMCALSDAQIGRLYRHARGRLSFECRPDGLVGPDMTVCPCRESRGIARSLFDFADYRALADWLETFRGHLRSEISGPMLKCDTCADGIAGTCAGGCMAVPLQTIVNEPLKLRLDNVYPTR